MPVDLILALIVIAVIANLVVMAVLVASPIIRRSRTPAGERIGPGSERAMAAAAVTGGLDDESDAPGEDTHTYDRVVRVVSWVFLLAAMTVVAASGSVAPEPAGDPRPPGRGRGRSCWSSTTCCPPARWARRKFALEGSVAITVATMLVALTGGVESPFFFTFPLIVGGAALVVMPPITITLTTIAALGYLSAVILGSARDAVSPTTIAVVGVNLTAMILLAYVAMVIAREQRRSRDAAIRLSTIDPLTGLFNRGFFFAALEREIARSARSGRGFCLLMMDLDELKAINDRLGTSTATGSCGRSARSSPPGSDGSTRPPATAATSSSSCCPRRTRPAPTSWPRRSGSVSTRWGWSCRSRRPGRRCPSGWSAIRTTGPRRTN